MTEAQATVYILDEFELLPGKLEAFLSALDTEYRPGAERRGMTRQHTWVTPPVDLPDGGTTVIIVWTLVGAAGFWAMRSQNSGPEIAEWWRTCEQFVVSRSRRYAAEADALPRFEADARANA